MKNDIKYHYLYKTVCKITNKYYIGVHSTYNLNDGYLGSGKLIIESIKIYGIENHIKEIIKFYSSSKEKYLAEKQYITSDILKDPLCLNISYGGDGGIKHKRHYESFMVAGRIAFKNKLKNDEQFRKQFSKKSSDRIKKMQKENRHKTWKDNYDWKGKHHKQETIEKIKDTFKNTSHQQNSNNSQFGTHWITNGTENRKIKKTDFIPNGWKLGRNINNAGK